MLLCARQLGRGSLKTTSARPLPLAAPGCRAQAGMATQALAALIVYATAPDQLTADRLAQSLVNERLAGCVQVLPEVKSTYRWEGKVTTDLEILLIIKTTRPMEELVAHIKANHPYKEPEIVGVPVVGGSSTYLNWLKEQSKPD